MSNWDGRLATVVAFIFKTVNGGQTWTRQGNCQVDIRSISIHDRDRACAVGRDSTILLTFDGGEQWQSKRVAQLKNLYGVDFALGGEIGYAVGERGSVLQTFDCGQQWQDIPTSIQTNLNRICVISSDVFWAVGTLFRPPMSEPIIWTNSRRLRCRHRQCKNSLYQTEETG